MFDNRFKRSLIEIAFYVTIGMLTIFLSLFAGFVLKGFIEPLSTGVLNINSYLGSYLLYGMLIVLGLFVGIVFPLMNAIFIKKGEKPWTQDNPAWYRILTLSWIYNPEDSFIWYLFKSNHSEKEVKWLTNIVRVTFISVLLFSLLGIFQLFIPQLIFSGLPPSQQFSETSDVIFSSVVPAFAENGALMLAIFLLGGMLSFFVAKIVKKENRNIVFWTFSLLVIPGASALLWAGFHHVIYGNSEASLMATFVFGYVSTLLMLLTGIFLWFFVGHFFNNFVLKLAEFVTLKEDLVFFLGIGWLVILGLYLWFEWRMYKKRKRSTEEMLVE
jgi:hypothetical protein